MLGQLQVALEVGNLLAARRYVSLGVGLTLMPLPPNAVAFANLCARPLDQLFPPDQVLVLWRRGATPRPQARLFIDFARQHLRDA